MLQPGDIQSGESARWPVKRAIGLVIAFYAAALPLILAGVNRDRAAYDAVVFHYEAIVLFAAELPTPDLSDYASATTPLYHLALSVVARLVSTDPMLLRLTGSLFTAALLATLVTACCRRSRGWTGLSRCLPFACSSYVFGAGVWTLPDNAAWLGVLLLLLIGLRPKVTWRIIGAGAVVLVMLVMTRQVHLWAASVLWAAVWMGSLGTEDSRNLFGHIGRRLPRTLMAVLATLPAFVVVALFYLSWGGLVPPRFQGMYSGWSPATPAFLLMLVAAFGTFFLADIAPRMVLAWKRYRTVLVASVGLGLVLALAPETSYSTEFGRFSGIWNLSRRFDVGRTSLLIVALAPVGAAYFTSIVVTVRFRERWVALAAISGFIAAQMASPMLWQRYNDPFVLMLLAMLLSRSIDLPEPPTGAARARVVPARGVLAVLHKARGVGPTVLAVLLAVVTFLKISGGAEVRPAGEERAVERGDTAEHDRAPIEGFV
ncbi:MAG: hypothetical protein AAGG07_07135 [Planctomycetota bacterium]